MWNIAQLHNANENFGGVLPVVLLQHLMGIEVRASCRQIGHLNLKTILKCAIWRRIMGRASKPLANNGELANSYSLEQKLSVKQFINLV